MPMKRLYLVRHAKSSWKDPTLRDFERPLNKRGKGDAPLMGQRLNSHQVYPDLIISSPVVYASPALDITDLILEYSLAGADFSGATEIANSVSSVHHNEEFMSGALAVWRLRTCPAEGGVSG